MTLDHIARSNSNVIPNLDEMEQLMICTDVSIELLYHIALLSVAILV